ncbi:MAG: GNAT family N-acetyltransferase [Chloroflexota bacterium]
MSFGLRPASHSDQTVIRRLVHEARVNPLGLEWSHFTVAVDDGGTVIGCAQVKEHSGGVRELASIVVEPAWRSRGVASALIFLWQKRCGPPLWLTCRSGLTSFYQRFGFLEVEDEAEMPPYFRRMRRLAAGLRLLAASGEHLAVMVWR